MTVFTSILAIPTPWMRGAFCVQGTFKCAVGIKKAVKLLRLATLLDNYIPVLEVVNE